MTYREDIQAVFSIDRIQELGWTPQTPITQGIPKTIAEVLAAGRE